jgi:LmbE family N-acetylglucosaminyl deacetylase
VVAHPDDETFFGPVLARYTREGAKVYLAFASRGEKGVRKHAGTSEGDELANLRHSEAICSSQQLKIENPFFFGVNDGDLGMLTQPLDKNIQIVVQNVKKLAARLKPDIILTWGPEGGYGHLDHRLVSSAVTQVVQSMKPTVRLFYVGFSTDQAKVMNENNSGPWHNAYSWHATDPAELSVGVPYTAADQQTAHRALECHKTQWTPEEMQNLERSLDAAWNGRIFFRPWFGAHASNDLFK